MTQQQNGVLEWELEIPNIFLKKSIENGVNKLSKVKYFQSDVTAFDNLLQMNLANVSYPNENTYEKSGQKIVISN